MSREKELKINKTPVVAARIVGGAGIGLFALMASFVTSSLFTPVQNTDAYSAKDVEVYNDATGYYVDVSSSATGLNMGVESTYIGATDSASDTVTIKTNSPLGYKLYISTAESAIAGGADNTGLYLNKDASTYQQGYIAATSGTLDSPSQLGENQWGYSLDASAIDNVRSSNLWVGMGNKDNAQVIKANDSENATTGGESIDVYYGVKVTNALLSGTYGNTVVYTGISEGVSSEHLPTMQNFTAADCSALTVNVPTRLVDERDFTIYRVTRMADGNCWMTDNLALNGKTNINGDNSNLPTTASQLPASDGTNVSPRTKGYIELPENISNGTGSVNTTMQIFSGVANNATENCNESYPYCEKNADHKYGNLYNWMAATAGYGTADVTTEVTYSICPKGWRLPTNGGNNVDKSYGNLLAKYGAGDGTNVGAGETGGGYVRIAQKAPLYFTLAGLYDGAPYNQGRSANYWSRTPVSGTPANAYHLHLNSESGHFYPQLSNDKLNGFSVRCVFGS